MILFLEWPNQERRHFMVSSMKDLAPIFEMFPNTHEIALNSHTFTEALEGIIDYISGHHLHAWIENEDISKSIKTKALALGLAMSAAIGPAFVTDSMKDPPTQKPTLVHTPKETKPKSSFGTHPMDGFLWNIQQIESSGGLNTNHHSITSGQFKGTKAIGRWGLLKPTVQDIVSRMKIKGKSSAEYEKVAALSRDQIEAYFKKNPETELNFARELAQHVHSRQKGNMFRSAYAWLHGHNLHPEDIKPDKLDNSDYVTKYKQFSKNNPFKKTNTKLVKNTPEISEADFKGKLAAWLNRREKYLTDAPMRASNYQQDPGKIRESALDDVKASSQLTPEERIRRNITNVNKGPS